MKLAHKMHCLTKADRLTDIERQGGMGASTLEASQDAV